ncbi:hypothetical protein Glove_410g18 [Diversispora epigaea]|uniref:Uncharacterized protein n=1 Tax=Diversispora epigaea TaxID=1348612 RepID=A0A397GY03_9GLOM|nr:hypothetical protein Glove_410g18 [Diversispora epigaea]
MSVQYILHRDVHPGNMLNGGIRDRNGGRIEKKLEEEMKKELNETTANSKGCRDDNYFSKENIPLNILMKQKKEEFEMESDNMNDSILEKNTNYSQSDNKIIPIIIDAESYSNYNKKTVEVCRESIEELGSKGLLYLFTEFPGLSMHKSLQVNSKFFWQDYSQSPMLENLTQILPHCECYDVNV